MTFYASDWAIKQNPSQNDYTGTVVAINDPLKDNRARIRIPFLHTGVPNEYLPWYRNGSIQGNVNGAHEIKLPVIGSTVKVTFENDDFYTGTFYGGYIDNSNNASDSFLSDYGNFDGWKDQWGNSFKVYNSKSFVINTGSVNVTAGSTMFRGNLGTTSGVTGSFTLHDGTVLNYKDGILIGAS